MPVRSYRDLEVWQTAMTLVVECYRATREFPKHELYGLASQIQRAAVSIPSNIAGGQARQHAKEFVQFLSVAAGSIAELETQLLLAVRLGYLTEARMAEIAALTESVGKMLRGLRIAIERRV